MSESVQVELHIINIDGARGTALLEVVPLTVVDRAKRAAVRLVGGVVAGLISIAFPLLHFCLPWMLPMLGLILAIASWRASVRVVAGQPITCPQCAASTPVEDDVVGWPARFSCVKCGTTYDAWKL